MSRSLLFGFHEIWIMKFLIELEHCELILSSRVDIKVMSRLILFYLIRIFLYEKSYTWASCSFQNIMLRFSRRDLVPRGGDGGLWGVKREGERKICLNWGGGAFGFCWSIISWEKIRWPDHSFTGTIKSHRRICIGTVVQVHPAPI